MYTLGAISDAISKGVHGIFIVIDCTVYRLIGWAYNIFMALASARIMSTETYNNIAGNLQVIIGVAMLFILSYAVLTTIVDPDKATKGDTSGQAVFKGILTAIIGLALAPLLFNLLYQAQGIIMEHDVIGRIFFRSDDLNYTVNGNNVNDYIHELGGYVTAVSIWQAVFHATDGVDPGDISVSADEYKSSAFLNGLACVGLGIATIAVTVLSVFDFASTSGLILPLGVATAAQCSKAFGVAESKDDFISQFGEGSEITLETAYAYAAAGGNFNVFVPFLDKYDNDELEYFWPVSTICGLFALYAFISFSFDMGIRAAKLAFYQIIAPIPIIIQVLPKKKEIFNQYINQVISTFIEVFIRIAVVYIVVFIICHLTEIFATESIFGSNSNLGTASKMFALALLIMGLIAFAKEAPKLISDTLGIKTAGGLHLGIRDKLSKGGFWNAKSIGATGLREGAQSFREAYGRNVDKRGGVARGIGAGLLHGAGSALWGAGRAAVAQTGTLSKPPVKSDTAQAARDLENNIVEQDSQHRSDHAEAVAKREAAYAEAREANRRLAQAKLDHDNGLITDDEYADFIEKARAAEKAAHEATLLATAKVKVVTKIDAWSTGTIDTANEEATIKFGQAMDKLKDLRSEAYKKYQPARILNEQYETEKAKPLPEYEDGWDEHSANEEYRDRKKRYEAELATNAALQASKTDFEAKRSAFETIKASGADPTSAAYMSAKAAAEAAARNLEAEMGAAKIGGKVTLDSDMPDFFAGIKLDQAEARKRRDDILEGLRIAMEAAADEGIHVLAQDKTSNVYREIQNTVSDVASFVATHKNDTIVVGYDEHGKPIKEKVSVAFDQAFGEGASSTGKFDSSSASYGRQHAVEIEFDDKSKEHVIYRFDESSKKFVAYGKDSGRVMTSTEYPEYSEQELFGFISEGVKKHKFKKATSQNAVVRMADKGKTAYTYVSNNDLAEKRLRQKQNQDAKNGGKK